MAKKKDANVVVKQTTAEGKEKSIKEAFERIEKAFGAGSIMKLGEKKEMKVETISTGSIVINDALGIGGVPRGRIVEIYGAESSGKTTLTLHIIAEAQKNGGIAAFVDAEHALDPVYAKALGVDVDELLISQPNSGEEALTIVELLLNSGAIDVIIVDSVAALVPQAEINGEMDDQQMGLQARLMSKALRKLTSAVSRSDSCLIFINQIREKIGGFSFGGVATTTSGGRALKFFSSVRMEIKKGQQIKAGEEVIGTDTIIKVTKNKLAPPFQEAKVGTIYGKGISKEYELLSLAVEYGICKKSGSWLNFNGENIGQGLLNVVNKMVEDKELTEKIYNAVMEEKSKPKEDKKTKKKKASAKDIPSKKVTIEEEDIIDIDIDETE